MFSFTKKQHTIQLGKIKIGGQPGENPTCLIGGVFFSGSPDFSKGKKEIEEMYGISEKTGNPAIADFFIRKIEYIDNILSFILKVIPENQPFSIDVTDPIVKIQVLSKLDEIDLLHRTLYNSIHIGVSSEEIDALKKHTPLGAFLVAFNPKDTSPDGKIEVLETGANITRKGLLSIAKECKITNLLIDTAALAPGYNSGASIASIAVIKEEYGFPTGCAIHNVVEKSTWLSRFPQAKYMVDVASNINISLYGGDFALYGSVKHASVIFPLMAWQDILISEYVENYFGVKTGKNHPRRVFFNE